MPHGDIYIWVNIGSCYSLLPDVTKPLPESMFILISAVMWHSSESNFTASVKSTILYNEFEKSYF